VDITATPMGEDAGSRLRGATVQSAHREARR
jgi:hypothetical protein